MSVMPRVIHPSDSKANSLPRKVLDAIERDKQTKNHSDFYYRLERVNEKIRIFRSVFYDRLT